MVLAWRRERVRLLGQRDARRQVRPHRAVKIDNLSGGKDSGAIDATFDWRDPTGKVLLTEARKMTFYAQPKTRTIDFDIVLTAREKVTSGTPRRAPSPCAWRPALEEAAAARKYGRLPGARQGEKQIWGKRADWVDYYGVVDGERAGHRHVRPPVESSTPDMVACARLRAICGEYFRAARF